EIRIYKNGRLDGYGTGGVGKTLKYQTNYTAKIGEWGEGHNGNPVYRFGGAIDEPAIFNRALSQTEIQNVYDARNRGMCLASAAQNITASNTNDSGAGSLRQAILDANASPGTQTINFQIPGAGVHTINLTSPLPDITDPVVIDGYTQPGARVNTLAAGSNAVLLIELVGPGAGGSGLQLRGGNSTVRGLVSNRFDNSAAININTGNNNRVEGCFLGTDANGTAKFADESREGVSINASTGNVIGGTTPATRNVISGHRLNGINIFGAGAGNNLVQGNLIGTDKTGAAALGNGQVGVSISGFNGNVIGGTTAAARNVISGNHTGLQIFTGANAVQGNYIGTDASGTVDLGNSGVGLFMQGGASNLIGGLTPTPGQAPGNIISGNGSAGIDINGNESPGHTIQGNLIGVDVGGASALPNNGDGISIRNSGGGNLVGDANAAGRNVVSANAGHGISLNNNNNSLRNNYVGVGSDGAAALGNTQNGVLINSRDDNALASNRIAFNGQDGIAVNFFSLAGVNNSFLSNSIFSNTGLGIDLGNNGLTANDAGDADAGANNLQNFPVVSSALFSNGAATASGTLNSTANTTFTLEFFSNAACDNNGEGQTLAGTTSVTTDAGGNATFSLVLSNALVAGQFVTATATDPTGNTSEFGACAQVSAAPGAFTISGQILEGADGLSGVTVTLSGTQTATTTTDAGGNYSFVNLPAGGNYTVTPARPNYSFTPPRRAFNNLSANQTANFTGTPAQSQPVSGRVSDGSGGGIANVTLYVTDATTGANIITTLTDANGNYALMLPPGGDYTITTAKAGLTFQPAARTFANLSGGQTSDFTAARGVTISGRVTGSGGNGIGNVNVTLSGSVTRTTLTLPNGSFLFNNLHANGSYVVRADSGLLTFTPPQIIRPALASDATFNLVAAPRPLPVPMPPIEDDFDGTTRDPSKFTEGTLTQPPGSKDPQVTVVQEGGKLKITPRGGISETSFNGYVTVRAIDFTDAQASVEVNQTADNGAQTIFAAGRDERNFFRFIAQDVDAPPGAASSKAGAVARTNGLRRLIFQARSTGVLNGLSPGIPFDPLQHRYWRFRHSSAESAIFFETSSDRVVWTEQRRVALGGAIGAFAVELSAGTSGLVMNPGQAIFDNLLVQPSTVVNRANNIRLAQSSYRVSEGAGVLTLKAVRAGDTSRETRLDYATEPHDGKPCNTQDGKARARCDFGTTAGTIRFAPAKRRRVSASSSQTTSTRKATRRFALRSASLQPESSKNPLRLSSRLPTTTRARRRIRSIPPRSSCASSISTS
ncbi:MAG TPA: carboxypeptidase regulatory-like domain-containing protein, partial [Pyrinomonadaceae bacterium]